MADKDIIPAPEQAVDSISNDRRVAVEASWSSAGFSVATQSRAVAAFDGLIGGILGLPADLIWGLREQLALRRERNAGLSKALTESSIQALESMGGIGERAAQRFIAQELRYQTNLEEIWKTTQKIAAEEGERSEQENTDQDVKINQDWLSVFGGYARNVSDEQVREQWAAILAGEIRMPNTFSLTTLRTVSEMDVELARIFEKIAGNMFGGCAPKRRPKTSDEFREYHQLEVAGLVSGVSGALYIQPEKGMNGKFYIGEDGGLTIEYNEAPDWELIVLTKSGDELSKIIPRNLADCARAFAAETQGRAVTVEVRAEGGAIAEVVPI